MKVPLETLRSTDLFAGLTNDEILSLAERGEYRTYYAGDAIIHEGETGRNLYIILSGQVAVECEGEEAPCDTPIVYLGAGQSFGEMAALDAGPRSANVRCVSREATLLVLPGTLLRQLCEEGGRSGCQLLYNIARDLAFKLRHRNLTAGGGGL